MQVTPSFRDVEGALRGIAARMGRDVDRALGDAIGNGAQRGGARMREEGARAGQNYGGAFVTSLRRTMESGLRDLEVRPELDTSRVNRGIAEIRAELASIRDATVGVDFDSDAAVRRLRSVLDRVQAEQRRRSNTDEDLFNLRAVSQQVEGLLRGVEQGRLAGVRAGAAYGTAFGITARERIDAALRNWPEIRLDANSTPAERKLAGLRTQLAALRDRTIGVNIDQDTYFRQLRGIERELDNFVRTTRNIPLRYDVERMRNELRDLVDRTAPELGHSGGERFGGAFADAMHRNIDQALRDLPNTELQVDSSEAQRKLRDIRAEIAAVRDAHVNMDIDDAAAVEKLRALHVQLAELALRSPEVSVQVNAARAAAQLEGIIALTHRVDGSEAEVRVRSDTADLALHRLGALIALGASLGPALVPAAAAAAAGIGAIATAAGAAGVGIGTLFLGFSGITKAVQGLYKYSQDTERSNVNLEKSQTAIANATDGVRNAEQSLANTREQSAASAKRAAQSVVDAQRSVVDAQRQAKAAQDDLTRAYEAARRAQEDQVLAIRGNALAQRQANLDIADAKKNLDAVLANPRATEAEREQARITYEQRVLQLDEITVRQKRAQADQAAADRAGIAGSDQVKAAQERVRSSVEAVGQAQQRLADAIDSQRQQQRQSAYAVQQAQQQVVASQRALKQAIDSSDVAGGAAFRNMKQALDNLSPAGQRFAQFIFGLRTQFKELRDTAQEGLLPNVQQGLTELLPVLPQVKTLVSEVAQSLGRMFLEGVRALRDPTWVQFFSYIRDTAVPALEGMLRFGGLVSKGLAGIVVGLSRFNAPIGEGLLRWAEGFAKWSESLGQNQHWQKFLSYIADSGPDVIDLLKQMWIFVGRIVIAAAPVGDFVVDVFRKFLAILNTIPLPVLSVMIGLLALFGATLLATAGFLKLYAIAQGLSTAADRVQTLWLGLKTRALSAYQTALIGTYLAVSRLRTTDFVGTGAATLSAIGTRIAGIGTAVRNAGTAVGSFATGAISRVRGFATTATTSVRNFLTSGTGGFRSLGSAVSTFASNAVSSVRNFATSAVTHVRNFATSAVGHIQGIGPAVVSGIRGLGSAVTTMTTNAIGGVAALGSALGTGIKAGVGAARIAMSGLVGFLGGPWGVAITAATVGLGYLFMQTQKQRQITDELKNSLSSYADALKNGVNKESVDAARSILQHNQNLRGLVNTTRDLGIANDDLVKGLTGDQASGKLILDTLEKQIQAEKDYQAAHITSRGVVTDPKGVAASRQYQARLEAIRDAFRSSNTENREANDLTKHLTDEQVDAQKGLTPLLDAYTALTSETATYSDKVRALTAAQDALHKAELKVIDDEEAHQRLLLDLDDTLAHNQDALALHKGSLAITGKAWSDNSEQGKAYRRAVLDVRDSLEAAAQASVDQANADIAAGTSVDTATQKHRDRIQALKDEAKQHGITGKTVDDLFAKYGELNTTVTTRFETFGLKDVFQQLLMIQVGQAAAREGISPIEAYQKYAPLYTTAQRPQSDRFLNNAEGGLIQGPGTGTSDSILSWVSHGEFIQQAAAVDYYGESFMAAINDRRVPRSALPRFATGGLVSADSLPRFATGGSVQTWLFPVNVAMSKIPGMVAQGMGPAVGKTGGVASLEAIGRAMIDSLLAGIGEKVPGLLSNVANWLWNGTNSLVGRILSGFGFGGKAGNAGSVTARIGRDLVAGLSDGFFSTIDAARNAIIKALGASAAAMSDAFSVVSPMFSNIWSGVHNSTIGGINRVIGTINQFLAGANAVTSPFGIHVGTIPTLAVAVAKPVAIQGFGRATARFAGGGPIYGPGTKTSDSIPIWASTGEYMQPAATVDYYGVQAMEALRRRKIPAAQLNALNALAEKGRITPSDIAGDGSEGISFTRGFAKGGLIGFAGGGFLAPNLIANTQAFIRAQAGKPYGWGSSGPNSYDCSGIASAVFDLLVGRKPYSRAFYTDSFKGTPPGGFKPGHGTFTVGVSHPGQSPADLSTGHMAGNLAGLAFESRGSKGVILGSAARSVDVFRNVFYLPQLGGAYTAAGGTGGGGGAVVSFAEQLRTAIAQGVSSLTKLALPNFTGTTPDWLGQAVGGLAGQLKNALIGGVQRATDFAGLIRGVGGGNLGTATGSLNIAKLLLATARNMGASNKVLLSLFETALVETGMRNLANPTIPESLKYPHDGLGSDHDSLGIMQQRAGWGSVAERMNVSISAGKFLRKAIPLQGKYATAGRLAQAVQVSAFPSRYDQRRGDAYSWLNLAGAGFPAGVFDDGGQIPPGLSAVFNGTGKPEPVLNQQQWADIRVVADKVGGGPANVYNFAFRDTTLDPGRLRALQDREAAMARDGRPR